MARPSSWPGLIRDAATTLAIVLALVVRAAAPVPAGPAQAAIVCGTGTAGQHPKPPHRHGETCALCFLCQAAQLAALPTPVPGLPFRRVAVLRVAAVQPAGVTLTGPVGAASARGPPALA